MRAVFQLPASMTSVVDAPRAVSSDASPTRPLCAVTRASMPAAQAVRRGRGFDAPAVRAGTGGGGENRGRARPRSAGRPGPGPGRRPCDGSRPTRARSLPRRGPADRRAWPEPDGGHGEGGGGGRAARLVDRAEVDGQRGVVNRAVPRHVSKRRSAPA